MRPANQQLREPIVNIDDIKDQLNLLVHEIRSFTARIDEMSSSPMGLKYGFDCSFDYFLRIRDIKGKTKGIKTPNKPIILLVLMILECLKKGPKSERDIKDFVTEKCRKCGVKATNRGTIAGANLEISSACNILGALGILEQAHIDDRVEPELFINPSLPEPPAEEEKAEDFLSLLAFRWSKTIETVVTESQSAEIASSTSITVTNKPSNTAEPPNYDPASSSNAAENSSKPSNQTKRGNNTKSETLPDNDEMDFVDILIDNSDHLDLRRAHQHQPSHSSTITNSPMTTITSDPNPSLPLQQFIADNNNNNNHVSTTHPSQLSSEVDQLPSTTTAAITNKDMTNDPIDTTTLPTNNITNNNNNSNNNNSNKPGMTRKSASSTKIWRLKKELNSNPLDPSHRTSGETKSRGGVKPEPFHQMSEDEITRFLFSPEKFLEKWGESSFYQNASLEIEEKILRRLASQCSLGLRSKDVTSIPSHVGTKYLDHHFDVSGSESVPMLTLTVSTAATATASSTTAPSSSSAKGQRNRESKGGSHNNNNNSSKTASGSQMKNERLEQHRLSRNPSLETLDEEVNSQASTTNSSSKNHNDPTSNANNSNQPREYDLNSSPTAQTLIDKVRKSKRHRGASLLQHLHHHHHSHPLSAATTSSSSIQQFINSSLSKLKNVCQASSQGYWTTAKGGGGLGESSEANNDNNSNNTTSHHQRRPSRQSLTTTSSNDTNLVIDDRILSVAEYTKYCHLHQIALTNQYLHSSQFNPQQLLLSGASPNLSSSLFRRYVAPLTVMDYESIVSQARGSQFSHAKHTSNSSNNTAIVNSPICYPDVMITTLEIPWKSIVSEFQTVRSEEMGLSFIPTDQLIATSLSNAPSMDLNDNNNSYQDTQMMLISRRPSSLDFSPSPIVPFQSVSTTTSSQLPLSASQNTTTSNTNTNSRLSRSKSRDFLHRSISFDTGLTNGALSSPSPSSAGFHSYQPSAPPVTTPGPTNNASTVTSTIFKCKSVSEVFAPSFREIGLVPEEEDNHNQEEMEEEDCRYYDAKEDSPSSPSPGDGVVGKETTAARGISRGEEAAKDTKQNDPDNQEITKEATKAKEDSEEDDDEEEDTSDEYYLSKHEAVLRSMREKWALLQKLKLETRKDGSHHHHNHSSSHSHGHNGLSHNKRSSFSSSSSSLQSPYKLQRVSSTSNGTTTTTTNEETSSTLNRTSASIVNTTEPTPGKTPVVVKEGVVGSNSGSGGSSTLRKRSYSLFTVSNNTNTNTNPGVSEGDDDHQPAAVNQAGLLDGSSASASASASSASFVKKRGRPPKLQKTAHPNGKVV